MQVMEKGGIFMEIEGFDMKVQCLLGTENNGSRFEALGMNQGGYEEISLNMESELGCSSDGIFMEMEGVDAEVTDVFQADC
ncbi:hypothetical protein PVK06_000872 [Gossypium arboreum]|uniref:Uncharacterized protein n=1 Tax=Gossypium arboreum TaxID=29729 RepID=A0ABR0R0I9_GOSAR|nr:hypothetical protein PVK06_000872 [Gossypium arboreum]